ncbi:hypothetical protein MRB53_007443 [Persea americana]|uniref:Uncharacterized protein n=2 Tax=Persea americana TaxID=3435 RepID=A0ACC2MJV9_PERAE|nr:hypothetical protein MRB53_007441 [Persea americana]KAJ8645695.1 hypothetical protein MRB53_007443 [Persea americana]
MVATILNAKGYVQVHPNMPVDAFLEPIFTYDGEQYDITIMIFKVVNENNVLVDAPYNVITRTDLPRCYVGVDRATNYDPERGFGRYIYYGGPGGRC